VEDSPCTPTAYRTASRTRIVHIMNAPRPLPAIGAPATRALEEAGVYDLDDVRRVGLDHLATLHGVGPKALRLLRMALDD
jgi:hypothetical protein